MEDNGLFSNDDADNFITSIMAKEDTHIRPGYATNDFFAKNNIQNNLLEIGCTDNSKLLYVSATDNDIPFTPTTGHAPSIVNIIENLGSDQDKWVNLKDRLGNELSTLQLSPGEFAISDFQYSTNWKILHANYYRPTDIGPSQKITSLSDMAVEAKEFMLRILDYALKGGFNVVFFESPSLYLQQRILKVQYIGFSKREFIEELNRGVLSGLLDFKNSNPNSGLNVLLGDNFYWYRSIYAGS